MLETGVFQKVIAHLLQEVSVMLKTKTLVNLKKAGPDHNILIQLTSHLEVKSKHEVIGHILRLTVTKTGQGHQDLLDHLEVQGHPEVQGYLKGQGHMKGQDQRIACWMIAKARYFMTKCLYLVHVFALLIKLCRKLNQPW